MKILLEIQEKYQATEIHICSRKRTREVLALQKMLEDLLDAKITVQNDQETLSVAAYEIVRIYSENKRVYVRTADAAYEVRDRLYALEEALAGQGFVRISNSEIVNTAQIKKLDMSYAGTIKMYMKNGDTAFVSRRYVSKIKEVLLGKEQRG